MPELNIDFLYWACQTAAMLLTCFLIPRLTVKGPIPAFLTVLTLAFINSHIWSAALFFKIPDSFTNRTLALLLVNGLIFWLVIKVIPGIEVRGILPAIAAPIVFTVCSLLISHYAPMVDWKKVWETGLDAASRGKAYFEETTREMKTHK